MPCFNTEEMFTIGMMHWNSVTRGSIGGKTQTSVL